MTTIHTISIILTMLFFVGCNNHPTPVPDTVTHHFTIRGTISSQTNSTPLPKVAVWIKNSYSGSVLDYSQTNDLGNYELNLYLTAPVSNPQQFDNQYTVYFSKGGYQLTTTNVKISLDSTTYYISITLPQSTVDTTKPFLVTYQVSDQNCFSQNRFYVKLCFSEEMDFVNLSNSVQVTFSRRSDICNIFDPNVIVEISQDYSTSELTLKVFHRCKDSQTCYYESGGSYTGTASWELRSIQLLPLLRDLAGNQLVPFSWP